MLFRKSKKSSIATTMTQKSQSIENATNGVVTTTTSSTTLSPQLPKQESKTYGLGIPFNMRFLLFAAAASILFLLFFISLGGQVRHFEWFQSAIFIPPVIIAAHIVLLYLPDKISFKKRNKNAQKIKMGNVQSLAEKIDVLITRVSVLTNMVQSLNTFYKAGIPKTGVTVETSSLVMAITAVRYFLLSLFISIGLAAVFIILTESLLPLILIPGAAGMVFMLKRQTLSSDITQRKRDVERELLFFVIFSDIVDAKQDNIISVFEEIRKDTASLFAGMRREANNIYRDIKIFGHAPLTILKRMSEHHPSEPFKNFILGYLSSQLAGGSRTGNYMQEKINELYALTEQRMNDYGSKAASMAAMASFGLVMVPMFIVIGNIFIDGAMLTLIVVSFILMTPLIIIMLIKVVNVLIPFTTPSFKTHRQPIFAGIGIIIGLMVIQPIILPDLVFMEGAQAPHALPYWFIAALAGTGWALPNFIMIKRSFKYLDNMERPLQRFVSDIQRFIIIESDFFAAFKKVQSNVSYNVDFNTVLYNIYNTAQRGHTMQQAMLAELKKGGSWPLNITLHLLSHVSQKGQVSAEMLRKISEFNAKYIVLKDMVKSKTTTGVMIAYMGSLVTVLMILTMPSISFDMVMPDMSSNMGMSGDSIPLEGDFGENYTFEDLNRTLLVISAFFAGVLVSKIKYGSIKHSMHPFIIMILILSCFIGYGIYEGMEIDI